MLCVRSVHPIRSIRHDATMGRALMRCAALAPPSRSLRTRLCVLPGGRLSNSRTVITHAQDASNADSQQQAQQQQQQQQQTFRGVPGQPPGSIPGLFGGAVPPVTLGLLAKGVALLLGVYTLGLLAYKALASKRREEHASAEADEAVRSLTERAAAAEAQGGASSTLVVGGRELQALLSREAANRQQMEAAQAAAAAAQASVKAIQEQLSGQLREREGELKAALSSAEALGAELAAVGGVMRAREEELAGIQAAAGAQAESARAALRASQRKVALLEAMVVTLRERLDAEEDGGAKLRAELAADRAELARMEGQRQELVQQVDGLRTQLAAAQERLQVADSRAQELEAQVEALSGYARGLEERAAALEARAAEAAAASNKAVAAAEAQLTAVTQQAEASASHVLALQATLSQRESELSQLQGALKEAAAARQAALEAATRERDERDAVDVDTRAQLLALGEAYAAKAAEADAARARLSQAVSGVEAEAQQRAAELGQLLGQVRSQLEAARSEADATRAELAAVRGGLGDAVGQLLEEAITPAAASGRNSPSTSASGTGFDGSGITGRHHTPGDAMTDADRAAAVTQLRARQQKVEADAAQRRQDLALLQQLVRMRLSPDVQKRALALEDEAARRAMMVDAALAKAGEHASTSGTSNGSSCGSNGSGSVGGMGGEGDVHVAALRREVAACQGELALLYRSHMSLELRQRERNMRQELRDLEGEAASIQARLTTLAQASSNSSSGGRDGTHSSGSDSSGSNGSSSGAGVPVGAGLLSSEELGAIRTRVSTALQQRDAALAGSLTTAAKQAAEAAEAEHQRQLAAAKEEVAAAVAAAEAEWRSQLAAMSTQQRHEDGSNGAVSSEQVRAQLLELSSLQQSLAAQEEELRRVRQAYEAQVAAAASQASNAQVEVAELVGEIADMQDSLRAREAEVEGLRAASDATAIARAGGLLDRAQALQQGVAELAAAEAAAAAVAEADAAAAAAQAEAVAREAEAKAAAAAEAAAVAADGAALAAARADADAVRAEAVAAGRLEAGSAAAGCVDNVDDMDAPSSGSNQDQASKAGSNGRTLGDVLSKAGANGEEATVFVGRPDASPSDASSRSTGDASGDAAAPRQQSPGPDNGASRSAGAATTAAAAASSTAAQPAEPPRSLFPSELELGEQVTALAQRLLQAAAGGAKRGSSGSGGSSGSWEAPQPRWQGSGHSSGGGTATLPGRASVAMPVQQRSKVLTMAVAGCMLPHVDKVEAGGEDAFFVSTAGCGALGVADGVGGWHEDGVNAAEYARCLMMRCAEAVDSTAGGEAPRDVLAYAQSSTQLPGSCTACIAILKPNGVLEVANVGDSGLRVLRHGKVVFATEVQEHLFNMPYQLACPQFLPETDIAADDADTSSFALQPGDIVVLGSDGLFDNVWDEQLKDLVAAGLSAAAPSAAWDKTLAQALSKRIASAARANSKDNAFRSPWAVELAQQRGETLLSKLFGPRGGKMDDLSVVVGLVT